MFAALTFEELPKKSILKRIFRHNYNRVIYEKKEIGDYEYYLITCKTYFGKADYDEIARLSGSERTRLVISEKITLPADCTISAYRPDSFRRYLVRNGALSVLRRAAVSPASVGICLYDRFGKDTDFLLQLLPYSINLCVLTERPDAYREVRATALNEYGAPVSISGNSRYIRQSDILIAPDSLPEELPECRVIFSDAPYGSNKIIRPCCIDIPDSVARNIPTDFDKNYFYAALCEKCMPEQLKNANPVSFMYDNREISIKQAADIIKNLDNFN